MKRRCVWCNGTGGDLKEIVLPTVNRFGIKTRERTFLVHLEHEGAFTVFNKRVKRFGLLFLILMGVCLGALAVMEGLFLTTSAPYALLGIGISVIVMGGVIALFPFSTPETMALLGARRSIHLARTLGLLLAAGGVLIGTLLLP